MTATEPAVVRAGLLNDAGRHAEVPRMVAPVLAHDPGDVAALTELARARCGLEEYPAALEVAGALTRADPDGTFAHLVAAEAYFRLGDYPRALQAAQEATRLAPEAAVGHRMVAWAAGEIPGQRQLAWAAANHATTLEPGNSSNHTLCGTLAMEAHDHALAEKAFATALGIDPGDAIAAHNLAVLRQRQGRLVDATEGLLNSARLDPGQKLVPSNLTGVVLSWLQRTHFGLWGAALVLRVINQDPAVQGFSVLSAVTALVLLGAGLWWTRRTVLRLGEHARSTMWRVLHRSALIAAWFWLLVLAAALLLVGGLAPTAAIRNGTLAAALVTIALACLISWLGVAVRRGSGR